MHKFAWIALGCLCSSLFVSACSDDGKTTGSTTGMSSSSGMGGSGGEGGVAVSSSSSSSSSSGSGGCTVVEQCNPSGPCRTVACVNGACVEDLKPVGTAVDTAATTGDCKHQECDAAGNVVETVDDNDKPVDYNVCTLDVCTNGVPSNPVDTTKEGGGCGTGQTRCMAGKCTGCNSNGNCPSGGVCDRAVCDGQKVCGLEIDVGKTVSNVDPGDCFVKTCDAMGDIVNSPAPNEMPPQDMNECDIETCGLNGVQHEPVADGTTCGGSTECQPRSCMAGTCVAGPLPGNETIVSTQTMIGDCKVDVCDGQGGIVLINDDTDAPGDPNPTDCAYETCKNGKVTPMNVPAGTACTQPNMLPGTCSVTGVCS
ncbi:MAG TPA: hypothetical protein PK156_32925 [Polyangium sp.]|nr:hypothetical protein [Polyangium sp.]